MLSEAKDLVPKQARRLLSRLLGRGRLPRPRRFIPAGTGVADFFAQTAEKSLGVVVLRWFSDLPVVQPGEDIDMLVADSDLQQIAAMLDQHSGSTPVDLYTAGGLPGTQYKGFAYLPEKLAARTIKRRVLRDGRYPQPSDEDYFDGLAYHAVYQKGPKSGLGSALQGLSILSDPEHDYFGVLGELRQRLGIEVPLTLDGLDEYLAALGYRPAPHVLAALRDSNAWIASRFPG